MMKYVLAAGAVFALASTANAAEFYLAQKVANKTCKILEAKPDGTTMIMIGNAPFATKEEAKAAKAANAACAKEPQNPKEAATTESAPAPAPAAK
jgi:hypothetical protein